MRVELCELKENFPLTYSVLKKCFFGVIYSLGTLHVFFELICSIFFQQVLIDHCSVPGTTTSVGFSVVNKINMAPLLIMLLRIYFF